ncbi:gasdermin-C [Choloepus didactylus]|uniref:gasdermin-C n=1 Tax=Choloepus didactylus TaxID=27675 RepID=UPI00189E5F15|nr:gasdermin-C [Choloepus didactylus]
MASLFVRDTRSLVRELGQRGELVPADSLLSCPCLRPFCLLRRKPRRVPWLWDRPLVPTDFSLMDVLEPGAPTPGTSPEPPVHIWETMARAVSGAMSASAGLQGKVAGSGAVTHSSALAVQTLRVAPHTWEELVEKRKLRTPRPPFLRELQRRKERESLYVVTEAVETLQDTTLQSLCKVEGAGQLSFLGPGHFTGRGQAHMTKEKTVTVPRGSVLAYRVLQLVIEEDHWAVLHLPEEMCCRVAILSPLSPGGEPDFGALQRQAGAQVQGLTTLPLELQTTLHGALQELLRDPQALQALKDTLEEALDTGLPGQLEGPGGVILSTLWDPAGSPAPSRGRAFLYVLGALVAITTEGVGPEPRPHTPRSLPLDLFSLIH